jgi:SPX domain protein involved in polyphosphate accumulation
MWYCIPEVLFVYRIKSISRNTRFEKRGEVYAETYEYILRKHMKLYTRYWIDVILMLRKENYELGKRYSRLINKIPFHGAIKRLNTKQKQKIKTFLGLN